MIVSPHGFSGNTTFDTFMATVMIAKQDMRTRGVGKHLNVIEASNVVNNSKASEVTIWVWSVHAHIVSMSEPVK
ncbi:hypothetical protein EBI_26909 [Enterocytozoon bieneusi H348]|nr:hypothetical protein EBI_26909 [Enterocytozoon bieneusi H348]|eukprot:XP_002651506.1 hypothetical protein EBI_26909 [Enterocytozoon bieneusi H348]